MAKNYLHTLIAMPLHVSRIKGNLDGMKKNTLTKNIKSTTIGRFTKKHALRGMGDALVRG